MHCPKCQAEVPEGHFYCPNCRVSVYSYVPESGAANGGRLERASRRLLDLVLLLALIGCGLVLARAIKWKELLNNFNASTEVSPSAKSESTPSARGKRRAANPRSQPETATDNSSQTASGEGTSDSPPKTKEPPENEVPPSLKPMTTPTPKPD